MKISTKTLATLAALFFAASGLASSTTALAAPPGVDAAPLPPATRTALRSSIDRARLSDPAAFKDVGAIVAHAREADKRARGRKAPVALHLAGLGGKALLPMLELVAFDAPASATDAATDRERASVERDLVEAIGLLRDPRALPVLVAVLGRETEFASARTAAEALARLDSDEAAGALLAALGKASGERATAILAGMGACHRASVARALAARLAAHPDDAVARHLVRSLGQVGNAWAWKTLSERGDEAAARGAAAAALVTAFVEYGGEVRESAAKALLVVDDASTSALLEAARRGATGDVALALDDLARRVAQNPSR